MCILKKSKVLISRSPTVLLRNQNYIMGIHELPPGLEVDVGNLAAVDKRVGLEGTEAEIATEGTEALVRTIFSLPILSTDDGRIVELPYPTFSLPRARPVPKERALTKWEQFAKEKGIQKKRRDRLVFDEATGEYVPRYGRGSKNSLENEIIIPHKESMADDVDPFAVKRKEKKQRVKDNKKKNLANIRRAQKGRKTQIEPMQALDVAKRGPSGKKYLPKKGLKDSLSIVQRSTASAGKFDEKVRNEPKQKVQGRRKKPGIVHGKEALGKEKDLAQKIADRVLMGKK